jgi:CDP-glucose 4,6-dehydratase
MTILTNWYRGRRVLVTGHTGFKGAWLSAWLQKAGAELTGYALPPEHQSLFELAGLSRGMTSVLADVRDQARVQEAIQAADPEIVFHLAAQSLVRRSYRIPAETFATNVMGTVHLLDAVRPTPSVRAVVVVTSDKCYENRGGTDRYREPDPIGGHDPYSASKGCAELVTAAFRRSFFSDGSAALASARAGNAIGGGDFAEDRLVPDLMRAAARGEILRLRAPDSVRPWQHVLEPIRGYLMLGRALVERGQMAAGAWNFGPREEDSVTVREVASRLAAQWPGVRIAPDAASPGVHEALSLQLNSDKAGSVLGWKTLLALDEALAMTAEWYRAAEESPAAAAAVLQNQIGRYAELGELR